MSSQNPLADGALTEAGREERELIALLSRRRAATDPVVIQQIEREIVAHIERHLRGDLRRLLASQTSTRLDASAGSLQFTELLHAYYTKILGGFPEGLLQAQTRLQLLLYSAKSLRNLLLDRLQRRDRRDQVLDELATIRQKDLSRDCPDVELDALLGWIQLWERGTDDQQTWATALELYYLMGMTLSEVGQVLGCSASTAERRISEALRLLRTKFA